DLGGPNNRIFGVVDDDDASLLSGFHSLSGGSLSRSSRNNRRGTKCIHTANPAIAPARHNLTLQSKAGQTGTGVKIDSLTSAIFFLLGGLFETAGINGV